MIRAGNPQHVVIVTRWREQYAEFARYVDHHRYSVTYIATDVALPSIPHAAADIWLVPATDDLPAVREGVAALAARHGPPARIIALKEDDLLVGAALREEWGCPGPTRAQLEPFRDKVLMSSAVAAARLPVEPFAEAPDATAVLRFGTAHGWPLIVKPRSSSSSDGVVRLASPTAASSVEYSARPLLVQAYNPHTVYHVDGLLGRHGLVRWRAARYINTCLDFRRGATLGSVEEDDPDLNRCIETATVGFLAALTPGPTVFHLEIFVDPAGRCTFLEVGARVGGGETPLLWREVHQFDLAEQAFSIQSGLGVNERPVGREPGETAGHLLVPAPLGRPCRITAATPMLGTVPGLYAEVLPRPGDILPPADSYFEHVGGRFRFRGPSSRSVETAIAATAARYRVSAERLADVGLASGGDDGHNPAVHVPGHGGGGTYQR